LDDEPAIHRPGGTGDRTEHNDRELNDSPGLDHFEGRRTRIPHLDTCSIQNSGRPAVNENERLRGARSQNATRGRWRSDLPAHVSAPFSSLAPPGKAVSEVVDRP
jgi:hypothetical protein